MIEVTVKNKKLIFDPEEFDTYDQFIKFCDQSFAEIMKPPFDYKFKGVEHVYPSCFISDNKIDDSIWEYAKLDDDEKQRVRVYLEYINQHESIEKILDIFCGSYFDIEEFAEEFILENFEIPREFENYINYAKFFKDVSYDRYDVVKDFENGETFIFIMI